MKMSNKSGQYSKSPASQSGSVSPYTANRRARGGAKGGGNGGAMGGAKGMKK